MSRNRLPLPELYRPIIPELRECLDSLECPHRANLDLPWELGNDVALAAIRLYPHHLSTHLSPWVAGKEYPQDPTFVPIRDGQGIAASWFIDTLELEVRIPVVAYPDPKDSRKTRYRLPKGDVATSVSRALQALVECGGPVKLPGRLFGDPDALRRSFDRATNTAIQSFVFATCNADPYAIWGLVERIQRGEVFIQTSFGPVEVRFKRLDHTCNVAGAVAPSPDGDMELEDLRGWEYKDNGRYVGDCCHTYIIRIDNEGKALLEVKIYDKLRYMLEKSSIRSVVGNSLPYILSSPQTNIAAAFRNKDVQSKGFGRVEARWFGKVPELAQALEELEGMATALVRAHCVETPMHQSVELFLPSWKTHQQTVLAVARGGGNWDIALVRWANRLTESGCGEVYENVPEDRLLHLLRYQTIGEQSVALHIGHYVQTEEDGPFDQIGILRSGVLQPDPVAKGQLHYILPHDKSRIQRANTRLDWLDLGISLPLLCGPTNGRPRRLSISQEKAVLPDTTLSVGALATSVKRAQAKVKNTQSKRDKRAAESQAKWAAKVEADREAIPTSRTRFYTMGDLAQVSKTPVTRIYREKGQSYLLVGKKWYKADARLEARLEEKDPQVPFRCELVGHSSDFWLFLPV